MLVSSSASSATARIYLSQGPLRGLHPERICQVRSSLGDCEGRSVRNQEEKSVWSHRRTRRRCYTPIHRSGAPLSMFGLHGCDKKTPGSENISKLGAEKLGTSAVHCQRVMTPSSSRFRTPALLTTLSNPRSRGLRLRAHRVGRPLKGKRSVARTTPPARCAKRDRPGQPLRLTKAPEQTQLR